MACTLTLLLLVMHEMLSLGRQLGALQGSALPSTAYSSRNGRRDAGVSSQTPMGKVSLGEGSTVPLTIPVR